MNSTMLMTGNSDQVIENSVMIDEIINEVKLIIDDYNLDLNEMYKKLNYNINQVDKLSDQTNLIAVNASIEAAQTVGVGKNFEIVADGIQHLSSRSRSNSEELLKLNIELRKISADKIKQIEKTVKRLNEFNFKIVETTDELSTSSHQQEINNKFVKQKIDELKNITGDKAKKMNEFKF